VEKQNKEAHRKEQSTMAKAFTISTPVEAHRALLENAEPGFRDFNKRLCPDTAYPMLGVRVPKMRVLAKAVARGDWRTYLEDGSEEYFEDIQLKGLAIAYAKASTAEKLRLLRWYIPKMDSWALTDSVCPTFQWKEADLPMVWDFIQPYFHSPEQFQVRFGVVMLMHYFLTDGCLERALSILDGISHEGYYVKMAVAWAISMIGVKDYERTVRYLIGENHLDRFTYQKSIQKMRESYRFTPEQKEELKKINEWRKTTFL